MSFSRFFLFVLLTAWVLGGRHMAHADISIISRDQGAVWLYGAYNRAFLYIDDGNQGESFNVDNGYSTNKFGLFGKLVPHKWLTLKLQWEVGYSINPSWAVSQDSPKIDDNEFTKRRMDLFLETPVGRLAIGKGSSASSGTAGIDFSDTKIIGTVDVVSFAGSMKFFDEDLDALSGVKVSRVFSAMDGLSRENRIRYDTPIVSGFKLSASAMSNDILDDTRDIALRFGRKFSKVSVSGGISFVDYKSAHSSNNQTTGSISFLLKNGLNFTTATGRRDFKAEGRDTAYFYYGKIGYIKRFFALGDTAFAMDFGRFMDLNQDGDEADTYGAFCVQHFKKLKIRCYLGYRHYGLDRTGVDFKGINSVMAGAGISF